MAVAVVAGVMADTVIGASRKPQSVIKLVNVPANQGLVKAVQLRMDDGREINLPMLDANKFDFSGHYKIGNRYQVFYSPTYDNLQLFRSREKEKYATLEAAAKDRAWLCSTDIDKAKADKLIADYAHKVDEAKVY